ncbi:MAG: type II secretion system F family protein [bacterium]
MAVNLPSTNTTPTEAVSLHKKIDLFLMNMSSVPTSELLFFVRNLGIMLKAGVSLVASLTTLAKQTDHPKFKLIITDVSHSVEKGSSFADSLRLHNKTFDDLFINMIEAGEISGRLESVFAELYLQMKKRYQLISKIKGALTYPIVILVAMTGIGTFMMAFIVPKITAMFKEFNAELPIATRILIIISDALAQHGILVLIFTVIFIWIAIRVIKTPNGTFYSQLFLLKMPVFGPIIKKINLAKFSRTISALLKTDIMIIKCFQITASTLGNVHYRLSLEETAERIKKGVPIHEVLSQYPNLYSPLVIQMVAIGEQTGEVDSILGELADFYEDEVDQIMESLPSIIEPILILVMGIAVGGIAIAIMMPMYSLSSAM